MLKIDRNKRSFVQLDTPSLAEAAVSERYDLQEYISNSPEAFFGELGQDLFLIGKEVPLSTTVQDRLDLLAVERVISAIAPIEVFGGVVRAGLFAGLAVVWTQRFAVRGRRELAELPLATSVAVLQSIVLMLLLEEETPFPRGKCSSHDSSL